jgi:hypothetical protein
LRHEADALLQLREVVTTELARRGIFVNGEAASPPQLLSRRARTLTLFASAASPSVPLPDPSAFHAYFISFCHENDLPMLLHHYTESFQLAPPALTPASTPLKPWVGLWYHLSRHEDLFLASLYNAAFLSAPFSPVAFDPFSEPPLQLMSSSGLLSDIEVALGTWIMVGLSVHNRDH